MKEVINWGILAPGKIAGKFASDLKKRSGHTLHAVASRSLERAQSFGNTHNIPHFFGSYHELINCPDLDVVYIATPHSGHYETAAMCIENGIPVLCEKPLTADFKEAVKLVELARKNDVFLMEAIWTRFLPSMLKTLELIEQGSIGTIHGIKADFGFKADFNPTGRLFNPELAGGSLLDIGIYPVFLSLLILGKPTRIQATGFYGSTGVDEEVAMIFDHGSGKISTLHSSIRNHTKTEAFIYGTEGCIHLQTRWHEATMMTLLRNDEAPIAFNFDNQGFGYGFEMDEVARCLKLGLKESPILPLDFSLELMKILDDVLHLIKPKS